MLNLLVYLLFILTVAITAGGIILSARLRKKYRASLFSTLLYFQVFIFAFGFYGIWGQVVVQAFLAGHISEGLLLRVSGIALLLSLPFLVFAWLMLIRFTLSAAGKTDKSWHIFWFLSVNVLIIIGAGYLISRSDEKIHLDIMRYYFIVMHLLYSCIAGLILIFTGKARPAIHIRDRKIIIPSLITVALLQCVPLFFYESQMWLGLIFIMIFFTGNLMLPICLSYGRLHSSFASEEPGKDLSFDDFCMKYEISPRESDIVREICNGLSNKDIADKLFITLQTVKDHTHRIYIKTNVKSRVQLINLVKEKVKG